MSLHRRCFLPLLLVVAVTGCHKKDAAESAPASGSGSAVKPKPAVASADAGMVGAKVTTAETTGCTVPDQGMIKTDWTLTEGCDIEIKDKLVVSEGATLTISPGVKLEFGSGAYLEARNGKVIASGTADKPIVMTSRSKSPSPGDWGGILIRDRAAAGNVLDHVNIEYAGKATYVGQGVIMVSSPGKLLSVTNTTVRHSSGDIVVVTEPRAQFAKFENNTFADNNDGSAMRVPADVLGTVGANNVLGAPVHVAQGVSVSATWPTIDQPFVIDGKIRIASQHDDVTLTLPDGATLEFTADGMFDIGGDAGSGLIAKNVTFTSASSHPSPGDWAGFVLNAKTTATTLDGCTFEYAGRKTIAGTGVLDFAGKPADYPGVKITHTTFKNVVGPAMRADKGDCGDAAAAASGNAIDSGALCAAAAS